MTHLRRWSTARGAGTLAAICGLAAHAGSSNGSTAPSGAAFVDVAAVAGISYATYSGSAAKNHIRETLGQGACWTDYDRDGDPDLLVLNGAREVRPSYAPDDPLLRSWRFYENRRGAFIEMSARAGLAVPAWGIGCAIGDVDGDGYDDIFITTAAAPDVLLHNRRDGTFENWTARSRVGDRRLSTGAAFGDVDLDGDLDLLVAHYLDESKPPPAGGCLWKGAPVMCGPKGYPPLDAALYLNKGDGTFHDASATAGIAGRPGYGLGVVLLDANEDGRPDMFVANDSSANHLFLNRGKGTFREWAFAAGVAFSENGSAQAAMGVDAGDLDGDGRQDLVVTNFSEDINNFFRGDGNAMFSEWSHRSGLAGASFHKLGWAVVMEDFDLDGDLDLFVVNGHVYPQVDRHDSNTSYRQTPQLLINDGSGRFTEARQAGSPFTQPIAGRGAAAADFDADGDMDLVVTRDGEPPLLLKNSLRNDSMHWAKVRLAGATANREGIGARIEVVVGNVRQVREVRRNRGYLSAGEAVVLFGLGAATRIDRLTIAWPGGGTQVFTGLATDREWLIEERRGLPREVRAGR